MTLATSHLVQAPKDVLMPAGPEVLLVLRGETSLRALSALRHVLAIMHH